MNNPKAAGKATLWTILLTIVLTITAELHAGFKNILANLTGHHWTTKGVILLVFFFLLYAIFRRDSSQTGIEKTAKQVIIATLLGILIILGFYVFEYFKG